MKSVNLFAMLLAGMALAACSSGADYSDNPGGEVDTARIAAAEDNPGEWLTYGGTYEEQRFSKLGQITPGNVGDLGVAWSYDLKTSHGVEATPIVVDGVMYVTGAWSIVSALDAKTGKELWVYDPKVPKATLAKGCCDAVNRGVAIYEGKVFVGTYDGRLVALNSKDGSVIWEKVTVDQSKPYTITGAPRAFKDKVIIGNGGAELGVRGYVTAYNTDTGEEEWRFYFTPNPKKQPDGAASDDIFAKIANATWGDSGAWTTDGGGATAWDSMIYDEVNDQVIVGTGNSSPWNAKIRDPQGNGDNLFVSSVLALDADTGEYKWHFQETPRDILDYTAVQTLILADLPVGKDGANQRVIMHAPKNGFFYVLDAATGKFVSGKAYSAQTWATGLDENGRPIENPAMRAFDKEPFLAVPAPAGAHNWNPMGFSPLTGLAYIPANNMAQLVQERSGGIKEELKWNIGYDMAAGLPPAFPAGTLAGIRDTVKGELIAWDPVKQEPRWKYEYSTPFNGGVLTTQTNLLFQGDTLGTFRAFNAADGKVLWSMNLKSGIQAAPVTYEIDGEQYVAITTGWGTSWALNWGFAWDKATAPDIGRVFVFKLGAKGEIPNPMEYYIEEKPKAESFGTPQQIAAGFQNYSENCMVCHGPLAISSGVTPDLRWSAVSANSEVWQQVVRDGILSGNGMVSFKDQLTPVEAESIRAYVLDQGWMAVRNGDVRKPGK
jgi:PQQ-dependent dehydrogenase (methanol/ethanol family)